MSSQVASERIADVSGSANGSDPRALVAEVDEQVAGGCAASLLILASTQPGMAADGPTCVTGADDAREAHVIQPLAPQLPR